MWNLCVIISGALRASKLGGVSIVVGWERGEGDTNVMPEIIFSNSSHHGAGESPVFIN